MKYYGILMFLSLFTLISCNTPVIPSGPITDSNADTTPPHIADQVPIPGSSNVVARDPITLTFDEAIKPETINSQTLSLQVDGKAIATQVSFSQDGKTATITPENYADLGPENATLSVAIGEGITDLAGNKLERPTTDWKWEVPVWLEMGNFMTTPDADTAEIRLTLDKNDVPYLI